MPGRAHRVERRPEDPTERVPIRPTVDHHPGQGVLGVQDEQLARRQCCGDVRSAVREPRGERPAVLRRGDDDGPVPPAERGAM